jgi:hypothetical protein
MPNFTQIGGMKIVINETVSRENITDAQFVTIFQHTTNVEIVSTGSLTGFIIRVTIPEEFSPFQSDIVDSSGNLLEAEQYMRPETGVKLTTIIFKLCIIQSKTGPDIDVYDSANKATCTLQELKDEYYTQRKVYDTSMSYAGIPICPDVIALLTFTKLNFFNLFIEPTSSLSAIFGTNPVFQYLNTQANKKYISVERSVGLIIMESLPASYNTVRTLDKSVMSIAEKALFTEMAERVLANYIILVFRSGLIPLDAHMRNWMYDNTQQVGQFKIKAIDFGRVLDRRTQLDKIKNITRTYFRRYDGSTRIQKIIDFTNIILDHDSLPENTTENAANAMQSEMIALNRIIKYNQNGRILWQPDSESFIPIEIKEGQVMQIDSSMMLIHRIFVLSALTDSFYNFATYEKRYCQMMNIFNVLFRLRCSNPDDMIQWRLGVNLKNYLDALIKPESKEYTIESYTRIKEYIREYLEPHSQRGEFPDPLFEPLTPRASSSSSLSPKRTPRSKRKTSGSKSSRSSSRSGGGGGKKRKIGA